MFNLLEEIAGKSREKCKGIFLRANVSTFASIDEYDRITIGKTIRLKHLKKISCKGCEECRTLYEDARNISNDWEVEGLNDVTHNKVYQLTAGNFGRDFETVVIDEWNLILKESKEV